MAKTVKVSIIVDDDGSMRLTERSAQKLGTKMDKLGKSAQTADRQLKGVAQASANGSKNFAKQAQGISNGIVPVYAALAAQIFALGAAFRFLQDAGDLASLKEGQVAYASATGTALGTLTDRIVSATEAQINFRDAAQAAAIGTASGLSPTQLERLGTAAKDVSIVLGRDVTDSFNRLVRGVTKAEPELLDELGIVLRLKDATEEYARALGKNAQDLNAFERSQAVANDVLGQTERKYSKIVEITKPSVNTFNQFGKAFDDIVNGIKKAANFLLAPLAKLAAMNPFATLLISAPLLRGLFRQIAPEAADFFGGINEGLDNFSKKLDKANTSLNIDLTQLGELKNDLGAANSLADQASENILKLGKETGVSAFGFKKLAKDGRLSLRAIDINIKNATEGLYEYENVSKETREAFVDNFKDMRTSVAVLEGKTTASIARTGTSWQLFWVKFQQQSIRALQAVTAAVQKFVNFFLKSIVKIASVVGLLSFAIELIPQKIRDAVKEALGFEVIDDKVKKLLETFVRTNKEFEDFVKIQKVLGEDANEVYRLSLERLKAFGKFSQSQDLASELTLLESYNKRAKELAKESTGVVKALEDILEPIAAQGTNIWDYFFGDPEAAKILRDVDSEAQQVLATYTKQRIEAVKSLGLQGKAVDNYTNALLRQNFALRNGIELSDEEISNYKKARKELESLTASLEGYLQTIESVEPKIKDAFNNIIPRNPLQNLSDEFTLIEDVFFEVNKGTSEFLSLTQQGSDILKNMSKTDLEILKTNLRQVDVLRQQLELEQGIQLAKVGREIAFLRLSSGATKEQLRQLTVNKRLNDLNADRLAAEKALINSIKAKVVEGKELTDQELNQLAIQQRNIDLLDQQIARIKEQEAQAYKLGMALKQGLENGLQTNIYDLIVGDETSFKDAVLKTVKTSLESAAKELSTQLTNEIIGGLFGKKETADEKRNRELLETLESGGESIKKRIMEAFDLQKDSFEAFKKDPNTSEFGSPSLVEKENLLRKERATGEGLFVKDQIQKTAAEGIFKGVRDGSTRENALYVIPVEPMMTSGAGMLEDNPLAYGRDPLGLSKQGLGTLDKFLPPLRGDGMGVRSSRPGGNLSGESPQREVLTQADQAAIQSGETLERILENQTQPGGQEVKSPSLEKGFGGLLQGLLGQILGGSGGGGSIFGSIFGGLFGAAAGGIMPGGVTGYANGGIVKRPTLGLVGEGKMNEAVVPLPDGKAIPVNMNGAGNTNNVTVNVAMDNQGNAQTQAQSDGQEGANIGKLIAGVVQEELQRQKRPGGILSPYGAAS